MPKQSNKGGKIGRNSKRCQAYRQEGKRDISKATRILKHLDKYGECSIARASLETLPATAIANAKKNIKEKKDNAELAALSRET